MPKNINVNVGGLEAVVYMLMYGNIDIIILHEKTDRLYMHVGGVMKYD